MAGNNLILITFDSCRYDSFVAAKTPFISSLGETHKRYSFASWTVPSHHVFMMGVLPHESPKGVFASEVYKKEFAKWSDRLNIPDISFKNFVPQLSFPAFLKKHGYKTHAMVSMPVLNQATLMNSYFDTYKLMDKHNDFKGMVDAITFEKDTPSFYFLNIGETHYPYALPGETTDHLPRIHGVHGVYKHMDDLITKGDVGKEEGFFTIDQLKELHVKQTKNVEYLDGIFANLLEKSPKNTHIIVTADHGECFGEEGYFGHGPVMHDKAFEVFFVEGKK